MQTTQFGLWYDFRNPEPWREDFEQFYAGRLDQIAAAEEIAKERLSAILILTAFSQRDLVEKARRAGAMAYLVKPFHMEELLARLNALLRRAAGWTSPLLECGPISLDTRRQQVEVDARSVELTAYEYKVLEYLMLHAGEVVSKTELTEHIYEQDFDRDSNVLEVFVGRLRRKLDPDNSYRPIETLRGRGYRFTLPRTGT